MVENESLHEGAEITGFILDLLAVGAKAVHVTTDLTRVHTQWVGLTNLLQERVSGKMLTNQIKYAISFKVQGVALMAMHATFSMSDSLRRPLQQQRPLLHLSIIHNPPILLQSNGNA